MRYRDYKDFRRGNYYHIYNRGNNRDVIFVDDQDYRAFLKRIMLSLGLFVQGESLKIKALPINSFSILAFVLMPNHFHLLVKQKGNIKIDRLITKVCTSYAAYFNRKYSRVGHIFQDAFKAKEVNNDTYLSYLSAYIHKNPADPMEYPYSSLQEYLGKKNDYDKICDTEVILSYFKNSNSAYESFVAGYSKSNITKDSPW